MGSTDELTFVLAGPLTYTLKCKQIPRKRENVCKTVTSDNVENEWIRHKNVRSIDNRFEEMATLIEPFGVNNKSQDCCSDTWMVESFAEDLHVLYKYAPMKTKETRKEGMAKYVRESLSLEIMEFDTGNDLN